MQRIVVIGVTGSGKTTLAEKLANVLGCEHFEMDNLRWMADWQLRPWEEFRDILVDYVNQPAWVTAGNYSKVRDLTWGRADTVIWLDYSFFVAFPRFFYSTIQRVVTKEELFGGCVETFHSQVLTKDSLFVWFFKSFWRLRKGYPVLFQQPEYAHINFITLKSPRQAKKFLKQLEANDR